MFNYLYKHLRLFMTFPPKIDDVLLDEKDKTSSLFFVIKMIKEQDKGSELDNIGSFLFNFYSVIAQTTHKLFMKRF